MVIDSEDKSRNNFHSTTKKKTENISFRGMEDTNTGKKTMAVLGISSQRRSSRGVARILSGG